MKQLECDPSTMKIVSLLFFHFLSVLMKIWVNICAQSKDEVRNWEIVVAPTLPTFGLNGCYSIQQGLDFKTIWHNIPRTVSEICYFH